MVILQAAQADLFEIYSRYGKSSESKIDSSLGLLRRNPGMGTIFEGDLRRLIVPATPFGIFYFVYPARIVVCAIIDLRQNPEWIWKRLGI